MSPVDFESQIRINSGPYPPISVNGSPSFICAGLNVEFLDGHRAADFALATHTHSTGSIISGTFDPQRLGDDPVAGKFLRVGPDELGKWTSLVVAHLTDSTAIGRALVSATTQSNARSVIDAAQASHNHSTAHITQGTFSVERLAPGTSSTSHVLVGNTTPTGSGQWKVLGYTDVNGAAGIAGSTVNKIPYYSAVGVLSDSPFTVVGVPPSSVTTVADFGTTGTVTCRDIVLDYTLATSLKLTVFNYLLGILLEGDNIELTPGDLGAQTIRIDSTGGDSDLPELPTSDGPYVLVRESGVFSWRKLVGDGVGIN